jgi:hypothetical protein
MDDISLHSLNSMSILTFIKKYLPGGGISKAGYWVAARAKGIVPV